MFAFPNSIPAADTELQFADGLTMRNDFKIPKLNEKRDDTLFSPQLDRVTKQSSR